MGGNRDNRGGEELLLDVYGAKVTVFHKVRRQVQRW